MKMEVKADSIEDRDRLLSEGYHQQAEVTFQRSRHWIMVKESPDETPAEEAPPEEPAARVGRSPRKKNDEAGTPEKDGR